MTTGFALSTLGGLGYTIINYYAYKTGPCGKHGSSASCVDADGVSLVSNISIWFMAIPFALGGISELFVNVPAYGIAYSRAPTNMRSLVSAINLFSTAIAYAVGLACSGLIRDPYITWDFGAPTIIGFVGMVAFYFIYRDIDKEEYRLSLNDEGGVVDHGVDVHETESAMGSASEKGGAFDEKKPVRDKEVEI